MKEIIITQNDAEQRLDRFLKKYLGKASDYSDLYKKLADEDGIDGDVDVDVFYPEELKKFS